MTEDFLADFFWGELYNSHKRDKRGMSMVTLPSISWFHGD